MGLRIAPSNLRLFIACLLAFASYCSVPQAVKGRATKSTAGVLAGRVFAITNRGDLKPARIANIRIFQLNGINSTKEKTAGLVYLEETNKATEAYTAELEKDGVNWSEKSTCLKSLTIYSSTLVKVLEWVEANAKFKQVTIAQTDESGNFSVALAPGEYIVTVRGRAGYNEAVWDTSPLNNPVVKAGGRTQIKLSSPDKSCVSIPD
jgi:hypothetical protein